MFGHDGMHGLAADAIRSEEHRAAPLVQDEQCRGGERDVLRNVEVPGNPKPRRCVELDRLADECVAFHPRERPGLEVDRGQIVVKATSEAFPRLVGPLLMASAGIGLLPSLGVEIERAIRSHRLDRAFQRPVAIEWFAPSFSSVKATTGRGSAVWPKRSSVKGRDEEEQANQTRNRSTVNEAGNSVICMVGLVG